MSSLTKYELVGAYYLWLRRRDAVEKAWVEDPFAWHTVCELSEEAIKRAAEIRAEALSRGLSLPDMDLLIASTAEPPVELLTFDGDHEKMREFLKSRGIEVLYLKRSST